jgi:hypothetical protein
LKAKKEIVRYSISKERKNMLIIADERFILKLVKAYEPYPVVSTSEMVKELDILHKHVNF